MCSCDTGHVCSRCAGTPFDPSYFDDEPAPVTEDMFEDLTLERRLPVIMLGEEG